MDSIRYINRQTGQVETEKVYGGGALKFLYGHSWLSRFVGNPLASLVSRCSFFSAAYGWLQKKKCSKKKIVPFIQEYHIDSNEFLDPVDTFQSFNDFFIRKLKPSARPIAKEEAIIPADGRYYFYQNIAEVDGFIVKGKKFSIVELLQDEALAQEYAQGSMILARLCPSDYHRFHFPVECTPSQAKDINGWLYSVNPIAIKNNLNIFTENKRALTILHDTPFGKVLFLEVGATNVGTIVQTYKKNQPVHKGYEKGYFSFGGSALVILFPPRSIVFDADLTRNTNGLEIKCLFGQPMGKVVK
jgi:phosphatidylserine decarboxylase